MGWKQTAKANLSLEGRSQPTAGVREYPAERSNAGWIVRALRDRMESGQTISGDGRRAARQYRMARRPRFATRRLPMKQSADFASRSIKGWPRPEEIEHYFLGPPDKRWLSYTDDDTASFDAEGVDGTEHLERAQASNISLMLFAHRKLGVLLVWSKWDGRQKHTYNSKGDLTRL